MGPAPVVSAVVIFLDAERFIEESIASIFSQSHRDWELLLVDDGSTDGSRDFARALAEAHPGQVRRLEHPGHRNRGMSASRNLGITEARGRYIALLDADDVWLPHKLESQVAQLEARPEVGMVYGSALRWHSWQGPGQADRDVLLLSRVRPGRVYPPPALLPGFLTGSVTLPTTCGALFRRDLAVELGGFEEEFRTLYEDQAFFAKMALHTPILVSDDYCCRYRQHLESACGRTSAEAGDEPARRRFLEWLERYLDRTRGHGRVRRAIRRERWLLDHPRLARLGYELHLRARRWRRRLMPWTPPHSVRMAAEG